jgi:hypothetical protein
MPYEAILTSVMAALTAMFAWLRGRDRREMRQTDGKIARLEDGERKCRVELSSCRDELRLLHSRAQERENSWNIEKDSFQNEITRQERDRHSLTYENNRLLSEKCSLLEVIAKAQAKVG